jgi:hypothetical protein
MFALFVAYFLYGVTQAKVSQRPPISINKLRGLISTHSNSKVLIYLSATQHPNSKVLIYLSATQPVSFVFYVLTTLDTI